MFRSMRLPQIYRSRFNAYFLLQSGVTALPSPQADTDELSAKFSRFVLALKSRSISIPRESHLNTLSDKVRVSFFVPQLEQSLEEGNQRSAMINLLP